MLRRHRVGALIAAAAGLAAGVAALVASGAAAQRSADAPAAGKPVAPFAIEHDVAGTPTIGVPLEITLKLRPRTPIDAIEVTLSADDGLSIDASDERLTAAGASPEAPAEWQIVVLPVADGRQRLRVYAEADVGGERQGRSAVITLRVGAPAEAVRDAKGKAMPGAAAGSEPGPAEKDRDAGRDEGAGRDDERIIRLPSSERR